LFGHPEAARFTEQHERRLEALAAQAAVALDTASLYQEAQEAIRLRDEFLSVASHELKTPLTPLTLKLEVLQKRMRTQAADGPEEGATAAALHARNLEMLEVAMRQVHRLGRLVTDLLDVTRITAGRMRLERGPVELSALAAEVIARFEPQAQRARASLTLAEGAEVTGVWDRERLDQVVAILVDNALKYGAGKPVTVRVRPEAGDRASLSVVDGGIGIPADALGRIFERFARAVSDRHYGGLGLGLYIARKIVEEQGGTLEVQSLPGQETVFTVTLPRVPPAEARGEAEPGEVTTVHTSALPDSAATGPAPFPSPENGRGSG
jgi:signal transduction histidine kinase